MSTSPYADSDLATTFARLSGPLQFEPPARDLIARLDLPAGAAVLDVGTGTGIVARAAAAAAGRSGLIVGVDPSLQMLRGASAVDANPRVVGLVPGLPFPDRTFDAVVAGFVITHIRDDRRAIADMVRVCRPQGKVALTAWGALPSEAGQLWDTVTAGYLDRAISQRRFESLIPWEARFSDPANLARALEDAGLISVTVIRREYAIPLSVDDFLTIRRHGVQGQILRDHLDAERLNQMHRELRARFDATFGDRFVWIRDVNMSIGVKPEDRLV